METRRIVVRAAGADRVLQEELAIAPGTTVADVLEICRRELGLPQDIAFQAKVGRDGDYLAPTADLFSLMRDGETLFISTRNDVGGLLGAVASLFWSRQKVQKVRTIGNTHAIVHSNGKMLRLVTPSAQVRWECDWERSGNTLRGYYHVGRRKFRGEIVEIDRGRYEFYIINPPPELKQRHPKRTCFVDKGGGRVLVHFIHPPRTIAQGIFAIEGHLALALNPNLR